MEIVLGNDEKGVIVKSVSVEEMNSGDKLILSNKLEYKGNGVDNEPEVTMVHSNLVCNASSRIGRNSYKKIKILGEL